MDCALPTGKAPQAKRCAACDHAEHNARCKRWAALNADVKLAASRRRRSANPEQDRAAARARYAANPEAARLKTKAWRASNAEQVRETEAARRVRQGAALQKSQRDWRRAHPEVSRAWRAANPDKVRASKLKRRATGAVDAAGVATLREMWCGICAYCLGPANSVDHLQPVARGGTNAFDNLAWACVSCNAAKRDRTPLEHVFKMQRLGVCT